MEGKPDSILYIETDIPPRMTAAEYRRMRAAEKRARRRWQLRPPRIRFAI
jgi:hypothetical protein